MCSLSTYAESAKNICKYLKMLCGLNVTAEHRITKGMRAEEGLNISDGHELLTEIRS